MEQRKKQRRRARGGERLQQPGRGHRPEQAGRKGGGSLRATGKGGAPEKAEQESQSTEEPWLGLWGWLVEGSREDTAVQVDSSSI